MKIKPGILALLKNHGFQWYKDNTSDRVSTDVIEDLVPAAEGFTVIYKDVSVLEMSTAEVSHIDIPDDVNMHWIRVHWSEIRDVRH